MYLTWFPCLCLLTPVIYQFCIFNFAFLVSAYWDLLYFSSVYFYLISSSLHIYIYSTSVLFISLCFDCLWILKSAVFKFYIFFSLPPLWILTSTLFQFSIFYFAFLVCKYWHLQYFSSVYFTLLFSSLHFAICSTSLLYNLLSFPRTRILTCSVFQFCIFYFAFFVCGYFHLHYFSSVDVTLLSSSLHIGICSISIL